MPDTYSNPFEGISTNSTAEELEAASAKAEEMLNNLDPEKQEWLKEYVLEKAGLSEDDAGMGQVMIETFLQVWDGLNEPGAETEDIYGVSEGAMQMFHAFLIMHGAHIEDLKGMSLHEAFAIGAVIGLAHGLQVQLAAEEVADE
jgi:hypothetical protein